MQENLFLALLAECSRQFRSGNLRVHYFYKKRFLLLGGDTNPRAVVLRSTGDDRVSVVEKMHGQDVRETEWCFVVRPGSSPVVNDGVTSFTVEEAIESLQDLILSGSSHATT